MGVMSAEEQDVKLDFEEIRKTGCLGLGTAAVTVMDDTTSMVDYLVNTSRFYAHESCGQCTPCREGTAWMSKTMDRIKAGGGRLEDLDVLGQMAGNLGLMAGTTICGLADGAAWPIKNVLAKFRPEMEEYIKSHQSKRSLVTPLQQAIASGVSGSPTNTPLQIVPSPSAALRSPHA
jgi:NADH-quinone oxidoreductase subunit F